MLDQFGPVAQQVVAVALPVGAGPPTVVWFGCAGFAVAVGEVLVQPPSPPAGTLVWLCWDGSSVMVPVSVHAWVSRWSEL
ncbi:hypothetical protein VSR01_27490 [Actinacidiphila sp. DG2A-62]|uniref:hypothetical protein n=1 Tax=Actinacidiphila sp. DG2A-62 TaxID=3108821 RepID=UPI002DB9DF24|nr:hypothetical protein [Actinacidiphila sp. DG2A-62]MEC3997046.1 hypothetical protein [Actinacidiphila sp. DG2A-62]